MLSFALLLMKVYGTNGMYMYSASWYSASSRETVQKHSGPDNTKPWFSTAIGN